MLAVGCQMPVLTDIRQLASDICFRRVLMQEASAAIVVLITAGSREEALRLVEMLVGSRLAACVQVLPEIESIYHWQDRIERAPEVLLLVKTTAARFTELEREVRSLPTHAT